MAADYIELLRHPFWQKKAAHIKERDNWQCCQCHDEFSNLQVHHKYYKRDKMPWEYPDDALVTLCDLCHFKVEFKKWMLTKGQVALIRLGLTEDDRNEITAFILDKVFRNFYREDVLQYIEDIKIQLNG